MRRHRSQCCRPQLAPLAAAVYVRTRLRRRHHPTSANRASPTIGIFRLRCCESASRARHRHIESAGVDVRAPFVRLIFGG